MSTNYHIGDSVTQHGDGNIGMIKSQTSADPGSALQEMTRLVQLLRERVTSEDRQAIDESMRAIGTGQNVDKGTMRQALSRIAGIAALVGEVGVPVIGAIRAVMAGFGIPT
jgi:hypothetical protein